MHSVRQQQRPRVCARTGCRRVPSARQVRGASGARANVRRRGAPSALEPGPGPLSSVGRAQFVHSCSWSTHHAKGVFFFERPQLPNLRCGLVEAAPHTRRHRRAARRGRGAAGARGCRPACAGSGGPARSASYAAAGPPHCRGLTRLPGGGVVGAGGQHGYEQERAPARAERALSPR